MQPLPIDTSLYCRAYVHQGPPLIYTCDGRKCLNNEYVDLLNRCYSPANATYLCIFHSHGTEPLPNDIPSLQRQYYQLNFDINYYETYLRTFPTHPFVREAIMHEIASDRIRQFSITNKIEVLSATK